MLQLLHCSTLETCLFLCSQITDVLFSILTTGVSVFHIANAMLWSRNRGWCFGHRMDGWSMSYGWCGGGASCGVKSSIAGGTCYLRSTTTSENSLWTASADSPQLSKPSPLIAASCSIDNDCIDWLLHAERDRQPARGTASKRGHTMSSMSSDGQ